MLMLASKFILRPKARDFPIAEEGAKGIRSGRGL
jgi:hypothetical protein